jgi:cell division septum initiation protein DivIVA
VAGPRSSVLDRFRPAGAPGGAAPAGVPVDRSAAVAAELVAVFAQLVDTEHEAERIRAEGRTEAERLRQAAAQRAAAVVADAHQRAEAERAAAAADRQRTALEEEQRILAAATAEGQRVRVVSEQRMPQYVDRVVAAARGLLDGERP